MLQRFFFRRTDNAPLVVFRIIFGLLCFLEATGAMVLGWVQRVFVEPKFTFSFIGFEWLQPLPGDGMYIYFSLMALCGLGIMLGLFYRWSAWGWALLWAGAYFMQKSSYNNHYYLLMLLSFVMAMLPAHKSFSLDARRNPSLRSVSMPAWCRWFFIVQMGIVYVYAAIAKFYPDWWSGRFVANSFNGKFDAPWLAAIFEHDSFQAFISYSGFFFDLLIVPLLLIRRTRNFAFAAAIFFHLFNSAVFQIGIFPYLALGTILFFYPPDKIRKIFLPKREAYTANELRTPAGGKVVMAAVSLYFLVQLLLPLRHHFIEGNVFWTEEGHRLSWRMMLSGRYGVAHFYVIDKQTGEQVLIKPADYLSEKQQRRLPVQPDMIWQFAQRLKKEYAEKGQDVEVRVTSYKSINSRPMQRFTDPKVDIASQEWSQFKHAEWLLPFPGWE